MNQPAQGMNQLEPELLTIGELFDDQGTRYTVPIYQRNYAWKNEQIEQLLSDIRDSICDKKESYFLGNLIVTKRNRQEDPVNYEVIDGQQRLTTLYLLLTCLNYNTNHQGRLCYESRPRAARTLERIATEASKQSIDPQDPEDAGILEGYNEIHQFMMRHHLGDNFAVFLLTKVTVVRASLPPKTDFNRYFEIMNTRGQQLQQVDIVKARLMGHLASNAERACFAWIWDACADMDSYVQMSLTPKDTELRTKIFGVDWSWVSLANFEDLLKIHHPDGSAPSDENRPSVSLPLDEAIANYERSAAESSEATDDDNVRFRSVITFPAFLLHVLKVTTDENKEDEGKLDDKTLVQRFTESFANQSSKNAFRVKSFAFQLLQCRNRFDSYILKRQYTATNSDEGDWSLQRLVKRETNKRPTPGYVNTFSGNGNDVEEDGDVDPTTNDLLVLQSMLRVTYTSPRTMHWITRLLKLLAEGEQDKVTEVEFRFSFRNSIEHFYPQNPDEEQLGDVVSPECLHLLGNLALVSVGANSKFSNNLPLAKANTYQDTIVKQSPKLRKMAELTRNNNKWDDEEVRAHHAEVVELLENDLKVQ